ncbi:MAG: GNAT family N-acetyltransferase [Planctomycetes bacterium]|nr:GNAT family N-acetyltransferase [Planctomycetota bacterium]
MTDAEPIESVSLEEALSCVLAPGDEHLRASQAHVRALDAYIAQCTEGWEGFKQTHEGRTTGLFLAMLLPGSTAVIMVPCPGTHGFSLPDQQRVTLFGLERLRVRRLHYVQALLEPGLRPKRALLERCGFRRLTTLNYLERGTMYPWFDPPSPDAVDWVPFGSNTYERFAATLAQTYEDSQDCPELTGLRPIADVIASHQATGPFDPTLWELARVDGCDAGCLLLARLSHGPLLEIAYMGVVPEFRRRGVGALLLRRALQRCRAAEADRLTVVVDQRNATARRAYARFGFKEVTTRDAYLHMLT